MLITRDKLSSVPTDVPARAWVLPGEPVAVRLINTIWADGAGPHDDLLTPPDIDAWLDAVGADRGGVRATAAEFTQARALRDAVRRLADFVTAGAGQRADGGGLDNDLGQLNAVAAQAPAPALVLRGERLELATRGHASPVTAGLAWVAGEAIALLGGDDATRLRACHAPGCVLYFLKTHPRREWCSVVCGNRVRAARHYQRVRAPH